MRSVSRAAARIPLAQSRVQLAPPRRVPSTKATPKYAPRLTVDRPKTRAELPTIELVLDLLVVAVGGRMLQAVDHQDAQHGHGREDESSEEEVHGRSL